MTTLLEPDLSTPPDQWGRWLIVNENRITDMTASGLQDWREAHLQIEFGPTHSQLLWHEEAQAAWEALGFKLPFGSVRKPVEPTNP